VSVKWRSNLIFQLVYIYMYISVSVHEQIIHGILINDFASFNPLVNPYIDSYHLGFIFPRFHSEWCT